MRECWLDELCCNMRSCFFPSSISSTLSLFALRWTFQLYAIYEQPKIQSQSYILFMTRYRIFFNSEWIIKNHRRHKFQYVCPPSRVCLYVYMRRCNTIVLLCSIIQSWLHWQRLGLINILFQIIIWIIPKQSDEHHQLIACYVMKRLNYHLFNLCDGVISGFV